MKKKLFSLLLIIFLLLAVVSFNNIKVFATDTFESEGVTGSGTESDPYLLSSKQNLEDLADDVNGGTTFQGVFFKLNNNIEDKLTKTIGTYVNDKLQEFNGHFDGDGHSISLNLTGDEYVALFLHLGGDGTIRNLIVDGNIEGSKYVAGICSVSDADTTIYGCTNNVSININATKEAELIGGIVAFSKGRVDECENKGPIKINGKSDGRSVYIGGICGKTENEILNCVNSAEIELYYSDVAGGICGFTSSNISNCKNEGKIIARNKSVYISGICGETFYTDQYLGKYIEDCENNGEIMSYDKSMGITGICSNTYSTAIRRCTNTGKITAEEGCKSIHGIAHDSSYFVEDCENNGDIVVNECVDAVDDITIYISGICSANSSYFTSIVSNCINNGNIIVNNKYTEAQQISGIVSDGLSGIVDNCINKGNIEIQGVGREVGGIGGHLSGPSKEYVTGCIINSINYGSIEIDGDASSIAGILGFSYGALVENNINKGDVTILGTATDSSLAVGSISNASLNNCYITGNLTIGVKNTGCDIVCGYIYKSDIKNCFFTKDGISNYGSKVSDEQINLWSFKKYEGDDKVLDGEPLVDIFNDSLQKKHTIQVYNGTRDLYYWTRLEDNNIAFSKTAHRIYVYTNNKNYGVVYLFSQYVNEGSKVKIDAIPIEPYEIDELNYNYGYVTDKDGDYYTFTMPNHSVDLYVMFRMQHTHYGEKVDGQEPTTEAAGYKEYYECSCGNFFEDSECTKSIGDNDALSLWKANGNGVIPKIDHQHDISSIQGEKATKNKPGCSSYYQCTSCGKYYEDQYGEKEILDIEVWKTTPGLGYIEPTNNNIGGGSGISACPTHWILIILLLAFLVLNGILYFISDFSANKFGLILTSIYLGITFILTFIPHCGLCSFLLILNYILSVLMILFWLVGGSFIERDDDSWDFSSIKDELKKDLKKVKRVAVKAKVKVVSKVKKNYDDSKDQEKITLLNNELKEEDDSVSQGKYFSITKNLPANTSKDISKKVVIDYLTKTFKDEVEINSRNNEAVKGFMPLADTHFTLVRKAEDGTTKRAHVCFAYVYEFDNSNVCLSLKISSEEALELQKKHEHVYRTKFPNSKKPWFALVIDGSFKKEEVFELLNKAKEYSELPSPKEPLAASKKPVVSKDLKNKVKNTFKKKEKEESKA